MNFVKITKKERDMYCLADYIGVAYKSDIREYLEKNGISHVQYSDLHRDYIHLTNLNITLEVY